jgi:hypothetical protein
MTMDRRGVFFLFAAAASLLLLPLTPDAYRYVGEWLAGAYVVLALLSMADHASRRH